MCFLQNIKYLHIASELKVVDMVETMYLEMNDIVIVVTRFTSKICIILLSYVPGTQLFILLIYVDAIHTA